MNQTTLELLALSYGSLVAWVVEHAVRVEYTTPGVCTRCGMPEAEDSWLSWCEHAPSPAGGRLLGTTPVNTRQAQGDPQVSSALPGRFPLTDDSWMTDTVSDLQVTAEKSRPL